MIQAMPSIFTTKVESWEVMVLQCHLVTKWAQNYDEKKKEYLLVQTTVCSTCYFLWVDTCNFDIFDLHGYVAGGKMRLKGSRFVFNFFTILLKICHLSNAFWLYQHKVKNAHVYLEIVNEHPVLPFLILMKKQSVLKQNTWFRSVCIYCSKWN